MRVADARSAFRPAAGTVHDWLQRHAAQRPEATALAGWRDGVMSDRITYASASTIVDDLVRGLRSTGVQYGDRVVLSLSNDPSFVLALVACIAVGSIVVPGPAPTVLRTEAFVERMKAIVADCAPVLVVTHDAWADRVAAAVGRCTMTTYETLQREGEKRNTTPAYRAPSPIALLQYTSGSTGRPRGIVITHDAVAASSAQAAQAYAERLDDVAVTWVPLYHDMGLITAVMRPLFTGYPSVLLRPEDFARDPLVWLEAISRCGGTVSSAPNFAFELCVRKTDAARMAEWDLSRWRVARNAGEVVRAETMDRFAAEFQPAGFSPEAAAPSYGLAEATLTVTTCGPDVPPLRLSIQRAAFEQGLIVPAEPGSDEPVRELLSSGVPVPGTRLRIDGDGRVGRIAISGPQLSPGCWGEELDHEPQRWCLTSDLGFLHDGHLVVVGRTDDTLVYKGRNFFLSDVVAACGCIPQLRPGRLAPFLTVDADTGLASVQVVAELRAEADLDPGALAAVAAETRRRLVFALDLFVSGVDVVAAGMLPVTTSGKVRVSEVRRRFESGRLPLLSRTRG